MPKDPNDASPPDSQKPADVETSQQSAADQDAVRRYNETTDIDAGDYDAANDGADPITQKIDSDNRAMRRVRDALNRESNKDKDKPEGRQL